MADKIKFIIPGKPEYLTMVRLALGSIADTAGFDLEEIEGYQDFGAGGLQGNLLPRQGRRSR